MTESGISMVCIARDEAARVNSFIEHHRQLVDEFVVLDTGSRDNTVELATAAGAIVKPFTWCDDFSVARNQAISHAHGRFALCLDFDERIAIKDFDKMRAATGTPTVYIQEQRNYYNQTTHPAWQPVTGAYPDMEKGFAGFFVASNTKFFPLNKGIQFSGCVHENVLPSAIKMGLARLKLDVPIHHYGYVISQNHNTSRQARYLNLLKKKYHISPNDPATVEEYATALLQEQRVEEAVKLLKRLDNAEGTNEVITRARVLLSIVYVAQSNLDDAQQILSRAIEADQTAFFPRLEQIRLFAKRGQFSKMGAALDEAIARFGERPLLLQQQCRYLIETRDIEQAAAVARRVAVAFPNQPEYVALADHCDKVARTMRKQPTA